MTTQTLEICRHIADSLAEPERLASFVEEQIRYRNLSIVEWPKLSLAYGFPGLACFYSTLDECCPLEGWDQVASEYLQLSARTLEAEGNSGHSLFFGITGICFAAYLASKQGTRYQNLLTQLETILSQELERSFFPQMAKCMTYDWHLPPDLYNLMNGISGCIAYLCLRNEPWLNKMALRCLEELVKALSRPRIVDGKPLPGWVVSQEESLFDLSTPFGVSGVLATLSIAAQNGLTVIGQLDLMHQMASWLKDQQKEGIWERCLPSQDILRDVWDYGAPAVTRSLFLASKALQDSSLSQFAEAGFEKIFHRPPIEWNLIATPLTHGRAGLLTIADRMAKETGSFFLKQQVDILEQDLLRFYDRQHLFGFRMAAFDSSQDYRWVDSPFFLDGSAGVGLSLLSLHSEQVFEWQRALLIN